MTWLYVPSVSAPASAGSTLDSSALERLARSVTSNGKHSLPRVWSQRCKKGGWLKLLSGVTCEPSTLERGVAAWISSLADTRASLSARPGSDSEKLTPGTSGPKSCGSTARAEPDTCSARTSLDTSALASKKSSRGLPPWGRMSSGVCSRRPTLELPIRGKDCSSWPTPDAFVSNDGEQPETFLARKAAVKAKGVNGNGMGTPLAMAAKMWPTPITGDAHLNSTPQAAARRLEEGKSTLSRVSAMWPSPVASEARQGFQDRTRGKKGSQESLTTIAVNSASLLVPTTDSAGQPGSQKAVLNPAFVEALMGFPIGWTDCELWATPSSPK